jgi:hypothetical protein
MIEEKGLLQLELGVLSLSCYIFHGQRAETLRVGGLRYVLGNLVRAEQYASVSRD